MESDNALSDVRAKQLFCFLKMPSKKWCARVPLNR